MKRKIISIFIIISLIESLACNLTYAATQSDVDNLKKQQNDAKNELKEITAQKEDAADEVTEITSQISSVEDEIDKLQGQLDEVNTSIKAKETEISAKEDEIKEKEELLKKRLIAMYKNGGTSYLDILLGATGPLEMLVTYDAVKEIADADTNLINEVTEQKESLETEKKNLEDQKKEVDSLKAQQEAKNTELAEKKKEKDAKVASLTADEKAKQAEVDKFDAAIKSAQAEIQRQVEAAKRAAQQSGTKKSNSSGHYNNSSGTLGMPLSSYVYISSFFGKRTRPTAGASTNHGALDFAVGYGSPVYAAEAGIVVVASYVSGYGNYIMIWHKDKGALYTAYGHLSAFAVSSGETVSRGQQIGNVGSTGVSTGPHLHFEVYSGGSSKGYRVDPLNYLPI